MVGLRLGEITIDTSQHMAPVGSEGTGIIGLEGVVYEFDVRELEILKPHLYRNHDTVAIRQAFIGSGIHTCNCGRFRHIGATIPPTCASP